MRIYILSLIVRFNNYKTIKAVTTSIDVAELEINKLLSELIDLYLKDSPALSSNREENINALLKIYKIQTEVYEERSSSNTLTYVRTDEYTNKCKYSFKSL